MAITDPGGGQATTVNNSNNAATYVTGSFTPLVNGLILSMGGISDTALDAVFTDSGGITMQLLVGEAFTTGVPMMGYIALATALAANTARTMTMDVTGDNGTGGHNIVRTLHGGRSTPPFYRQVGFASGAAGTTPTVVMPAAIKTENAVFGMVIGSQTTPFATQPSGWTEVFDQAHISPQMSIEWCERLSGETLQTIAWGATVTNAWFAAIVEIYEAAQAPNIPRIVHHRNQLAG